MGDPGSYQKEFEAAFLGKGIKFLVSSKADDIYPVVSAASICAKVTRDGILREWSFREEGGTKSFNREFGCGYPGDAVTRKWLGDHKDPIFGFPSVVRFSWKTIHDVMKDTPMGLTVWPDVEEKKKREKMKKFKKQEEV